MFFVLATGCREHSVFDKKQRLLETIPENASVIAILDGSSLLRKLGASSDGNYFKPGNEIISISKKLMKMKEDSWQITDIFDGKAGIDLSVIAIYSDGADLWVTGFVADADRFRKFVEDCMDGGFKTESDIEVSQNIALADNRFWITDGRVEEVAAKVKKYRALSDIKSFAATIGGKKISDSVSDCVLAVNLKSVYSLSGNIAAMAAMSMFYDDAKVALVNADSEKGKILISGNIYDSKGEIAKSSLKYEPIDISALKELSSCSVVMAAGLPHSSVDRIFSYLKSFIPYNSKQSMIEKIVESVDGTFAIGVNDISNIICSQNNKPGITVLVQTSGVMDACAIDYITSQLDLFEPSLKFYSSDGLLRIINYDSVPETVADSDIDISYFKDAHFGIIFDLNTPSLPDELCQFRIKSIEKDSGMICEGELITSDSGEQAILTLFKSLIH